MHPFEDNLAISWPPAEWQDVTVLVAVSGGADSVALVCGLSRIRQAGPGRLVAAHFHHGMRGAEADEDEAFVRRLADRLRLDCVVGHRSPSAPPVSEQSAREARYAFLRTAAGSIGARYVVTAHTADDQAETILHRVLRGTGIGGLAGIRRCRELMPGVALLRPILDQRRAAVLAYLECLGEGYRVDASNQDRAYTRNRIRHELLAAAAEVHPQVVSALVRLGSQAEELRQYLDLQAERLAEASRVQSTTGQISFVCGPLSEMPRLLVRQLLVRLWRQQGWPEAAMGFVQWDQLAGMVQEGVAGGEPRQTILPGGVIARREGDQLTLLAPPQTSLS